MIYLVTSSTDNYWATARPYYRSLRRLNEEIYPIVFSVGCEAPAWVHELGLACFTMTDAENAGASELRSISHGSFLRWLPTADPDDVIIFTDSDMLLQRPLDSGEMATLTSLPDDVYFAGYNAGFGDDLYQEALRLRPRLYPAELDEVFPAYDNAPCANTGLIVARREAYDRIYREYMARHDRCDRAFEHPSRNQWLINYAAFAAALRLQVMPVSWHCHFHYGVPPGVRAEGPLVLDGDRPVLWTHKTERFIHAEVING